MFHQKGGEDVRSTTNCLKYVRFFKPCVQSPTSFIIRVALSFATVGYKNAV